MPFLILLLQIGEELMLSNPLLAPVLVIQHYMIAAEYTNFLWGVLVDLSIIFQILKTILQDNSLQ